MVGEVGEVNGSIPMRRRLGFAALLCTTAALSGCLGHTGARADFAIPGCEQAWNRVDGAQALPALRTIVRNDCQQLYAAGWRLPMGGSSGGTVLPDQCNPAWQQLNDAGQLDNVAFLVTHNCPVFYRHGWILPPR